MPETLMTLNEHFVKARSVNQTSNGFVSKVPTLTEPVADAGTATGQATINLRGTGTSSVTQNLALICPYATGSNNNTFSMRVIGWRTVVNGTNAASPREWIPVLICEVLCTISSTAAGVASGVVSNTEYFADTIAITYPSTAPSSVEIVSNAADVIAHLVVDMKGFSKLELSFTTGGSATDCNALVAKY